MHEQPRNVINQYRSVKIESLVMRDFLRKIDLFEVNEFGTNYEVNSFGFSYNLIKLFLDRYLLECLAYLGFDSGILCYPFKWRSSGQ